MFAFTHTTWRIFFGGNCGEKISTSWPHTHQRSTQLSRAKASQTTYATPLSNCGLSLYQAMPGTDHTPLRFGLHTVCGTLESGVCYNKHPQTPKQQSQQPQRRDPNIITSKHFQTKNTRNRQHKATPIGRTAPCTVVAVASIAKTMVSSRHG